jgi:hypothetical protein
VAAVVPAVDEATDRGDEVFDASEAAAADGLASDDAEEDLDHVEPGSRGGLKFRVIPSVVFQPGAHRGVFVGAVVVQHDVQLLWGRPWRPLEESQDASKSGSMED